MWSTSDLPASLTGTIIQGSHGSKWKVGAKVGEGKCCVTFSVGLVEETIKGALKVYRKGENYVAASERERMLLGMHHKEYPEDKQFVVKLLDYFMYQGHCCLIEELLDVDVWQLMLKNENEALTYYMIQQLLKDVLRSLEALHNLGYIHGDIKPANILWSKENGCWKLIDFSLSFQENNQDVYVVQSPRYQAPEAKLKQHGIQQFTLTPQVDMWGLACVAMELFTSKYLFTDANEISVCDNCKQFDNKEKCKYSAMVQQIIERDKKHTGASHNEFEELIKKMLCCHAEERLSAKKAMEHNFLSQYYEPTFKDLLLLPYPVLRLLNLICEDNLNMKDYIQEVKEDIIEECSKFGKVEQCHIPVDGQGRGKVFVLFMETDDCEKATQALCGRIFDGRTVLTSYYPAHLLTQDILL